MTMARPRIALILFASWAIGSSLCCRAKEETTGDDDSHRREIVLPPRQPVLSEDDAASLSEPIVVFTPRESLRIRGTVVRCAEVPYILVEFRYRGADGHPVTANSGIAAAVRQASGDWDYSVNLDAPVEERRDYYLVVMCGDKYLLRTPATVKAH